MGFYERQVLPRLIDKLCGAKQMRPLREQAVEGLHGTVVEIGFGSGTNVPVYPPEVAQVHAVDPSTVARSLAQKRLAASSVPVTFVGLDGAHLPLPDASCDTALSTFTLCTVPDPATVLAEVRRVLRPGGTFHFVEHGLAPDADVVRKQRRIEPFNKRIAGGCHLTRDHWALVEDAGFVLERRVAAYGDGPKPYAYHYLGTARVPASAPATDPSS